jgi:glycosyltransferase involved in cell wall biosynthesis
MPSVSEPFGIAPLEALLCDVPVIISKQSGVSEILHHVLKVNFWDIDEMADNMIAVLKYPALVKEMMLRASEEIKRIRWQNSAARVIGIYRRVLAAAGPT